MKRIHTVNTMELAFPADKIWEVITDLSGYAKWWPPSTKVRPLRISQEIIGSQVEVRPYGGQAFLCEVTAIKRNGQLTMTYSGIYSGTGVWTISESNGRSRVSYEIVLEINDLWIRLLSLLLPIASIHSRLMNKILSGLEQYLVKVTRRTEQTVPPDRR